MLKSWNEIQHKPIIRHHKIKIVIGIDNRIKFYCDSFDSRFDLKFVEGEKYSLNIIRKKLIAVHKKTIIFSIQLSRKYILLCYMAWLREKYNYTGHSRCSNNHEKHTNIEDNRQRVCQNTLRPLYFMICAHCQWFRPISKQTLGEFHFS